MSYKNTIFDLTGKVAIVTGGASHLGSVFSKILHDAGARLTITSRDLDKANNFINTLSNEHLALSTDLEDENSLNEIIEKTMERFGRIDILVNNAIKLTPANIDKAGKDDFDLAFGTGVYAPFHLSRKVKDIMKKNGGGSIINIGSMYGMVTSYPSVYENLPFGSPPSYHATKGGLIHLTRYLAAYFAKDNIRVNCISPGAFPNKGKGKDWDEFIKRLKEKVPLNRMGTPEELAGTLLLLASNASSYITGQNFIVDGGFTIW